MRKEEVDPLMRFLDGEATAPERRWARWTLAVRPELRDEFLRLRRVSLELRRLAAVPRWRGDEGAPEA